MNKKGNGFISFQEFSTIMSEKFYRKYSRKEVQAAFDMFDRKFIL